MDKRGIGELEAEALAQARLLVAKRFKEPTSLDEASAIYPLHQFVAGFVVLIIRER